jgi:hypothetical protein
MHNNTEDKLSNIKSKNEIIITNNLVKTEILLILYNSQTNEGSTIKDFILNFRTEEKNINDIHHFNDGLCEYILENRGKELISYFNKDKFPFQNRDRYSSSSQHTRCKLKNYFNFNYFNYLIFIILKFYLYRYKRNCSF